MLAEIIEFYFLFNLKASEIVDGALITLKLGEILLIWVGPHLILKI